MTLDISVCVHMDVGGCYVGVYVYVDCMLVMRIRMGTAPFCVVWQVRYDTIVLHT